MRELTKIGTKEIRKCFDGKMHEVTVMDYLVKLYGNTYHNRYLLKGLGFRWYGMGEKYWCKNIDSDEELEQIQKAIEGKNIQLYAESVFRITDSATNPIKY